ncbi:F-box only protein 48 isoform X1 [Solea solea]|uniref:F-box only protein 48 isoform X1 n=1 Tax=Solea solea TaxID=90069 RepID=UPI00272B7037|nr:F-box only protein 48 isoform X1 [Solea solea]
MFDCQTKHEAAMMKHDLMRTPSVFFLCKGQSSLMSSGDTLPQNFAETLPTEMSVKIFEELDTVSLCSASQTCRLWRDIIQDSEQLWRTQCLLIRAVCQREVDGDRRDGLSWKVTLVKNYTRSCVKKDWLKGRYSHVTSAEQLIGRRMTALDAETWGDILQAELDR